MEKLSSLLSSHTIPVAMWIAALCSRSAMPATLASSQSTITGPKQGNSQAAACFFTEDSTRFLPESSGALTIFERQFALDRAEYVIMARRARFTGDELCTFLQRFD